MELGAFSVSLSVKDLKASRAFYEKLGFEVMVDNTDQNWLIMKNQDHVIGLFQGMFENNILTFNPGWKQDASAIDDFTDIRDIQKSLKNQGVDLMSEADDTSNGPASLMLTDPDGNQILIDQHL